MRRIVLQWVKLRRLIAAMKTTTQSTDIPLPVLRAVNDALGHCNWTNYNPLQLAAAGRLAPGQPTKDWAQAEANKVFGDWFDSVGLKPAIAMRKQLIESFCDAVEAEYFANNGVSV